MHSNGQRVTRVVLEGQPAQEDALFPDGDRFQYLEGPIQGGMGAVFKALEKSLNRTVAIKRMLPKYAASQELRERFRREAEAMARCKHSGLIPIYDHNEDSAGLYIVMSVTALAAFMP